jgi:hypothetical protein
MLRRLELAAPFVLSVSIVLFPAAGTAQAQLVPNQPSRVEVLGGWAVAFPTSDGLLESQYEPPLLNGGAAIASATMQTLNVGTESGGGIHAGVNVFVTGLLGVQIAFTRSSADVSGSPGTYDDFIRYVSLPPPDYRPVESTFENTSPAPPAAGRLVYQSLAGGGVLRWRAAEGRVGGTFAGGVTFDRHSGEVENVIYTQFVLGGHSTLFPVHHRVVMELTGDRGDVAPYVAADFHVTISARVALLAGLRGTLAPQVMLVTRPARLVDPKEAPWAPEIADVQTVMGDQPLYMYVPVVESRPAGAGRWHFLLGAKVFVK